MQCRLRHWHFLGIILFLVCTTIAPAQEDHRSGRGHQGGAGSGEHSSEHNIPPHFQEWAVVLEINARVVEQNQVVIWSETYRKTTIHRRPVEVRLVNANVVVVAQFTPHIRRSQKYLMAQGQVWIEVPGQGVRYHTTMQTIPLEFNEPIYFFPLGQHSGQSFTTEDQNSAYIEVMLTLHPFEE
ncbi:MAG: hypothetical protein FWG89_04610 [Treponema sp.]|nr:hypothetical protein [Treponema sp.]